MAKRYRKGTEPGVARPLRNDTGYKETVRGKVERRKKLARFGGLIQDSRADRRRYRKYGTMATGEFKRGR